VSRDRARSRRLAARAGRWARPLGAGLLALGSACTSAPARTALQGDLPALKAAIARAEQEEALGSAGVKDLASAVLEGGFAADVPALGEAARLDPDSEARALAIRALGRIGGEDAVLELIDVYAVASPEDRREVVRAWSMPASLSAGGATQLEDLAQTSGEPAVLAAIALAGRPSSAGLASAALVRAIEGDTRETRLLAIEAAPWSDSAVRAAIVAARKHRDPATRVLSLWRSAEAGALDAEGSQTLEQLSADDVTNVGAVARAARARAGQSGVKAALRVDLAASASERRTLAALSLLRLEDWAGAARALGDDSPRVRRVVACQVLAGPAHERATDPIAIAAGASPSALAPLLITESAG
jgi:hypothetical protein